MRDSGGNWPPGSPSERDRRGAAALHAGRASRRPERGEPPRASDVLGARPMMGSSAAGSSGSSATTRRPRRRAAHKNLGRPCLRRGWRTPARRGSKRRTRRWSVLAAEERIDGRSLAERRDVAERSGDLQQAAELSREPNVHLGPERYRAMRGGESAAVQRAGRVDQVNAADRGERATDNRRVERLGRETAGIEARLKETYDRLRAEVAKRIRASSPSNTPRIRSG